MNLIVSIADVGIRILSDIPLMQSDEFLPFLGNEKYDFTVVMARKESFDEKIQRILFSENKYKVIETDSGKIERFFYEVNERPYAVSCFDKEKRIVNLYYKNEEIENVNHVRGIFYHINWENILLQAGRFIFHSSCVATRYGGILFSGPSGIGKSTQGDLWCEYEDARLINGDRPILSKDSGQWMAYGSPYAGSSDCYRNESVPVSIIVMLKQDKECSIRKLSIFEAYRRIVEQITINSWDREFMLKVYEHTEQLIQDIPVYELACTPDEKAVKLLKEIIIREKIHAAT